MLVKLMVSFCLIMIIAFLGSFALLLNDVIWLKDFLYK